MNSTGYSGFQFTLASGDANFGKCFCYFNDGRLPDDPPADSVSMTGGSGSGQVTGNGQSGYKCASVREDTGGDEDCINEMPTDGSAGAVAISFFRNDVGGETGDPCPIDCTAATPFKVGWYPINDGTNYCYQWPGNSGKNSMNYGTCDNEESTFTYTQWTNCECSGDPGAIKTVPVNGCVVDMPTSICQMVTNYTACA